MHHAARGNLETMILAVLSEGPAHGYVQIEAIRQRSGGVFDVAEGTLYPALHKLEAVGLVRSRWSEAGGRRRRVYRLTTLGERALGERRARWREARDAIDAVIGAPTWNPAC